MFIYIRYEEKDVKIQCNPTDDIKEIREKINEKAGEKYSPEKQRLFFGGKQLEDGNTLFHYGIKNTNTILLFQKVSINQQEFNLDNNLDNNNNNSSNYDDNISSSSPTTVKETVVAQESSKEDQPQQNGPTNNDKDQTTNGNNNDAITTENCGNTIEEEYYCEKCNNNKRKKCKECGCNLCGGKEDEENTIVCDECQYYYHFNCLNPPLQSLPGDLSNSKKAKMPSATQTRKWGGGMACVGTTKKCEVVGSDHFGPIPGIPVGSSWKYRVSCSESGVHRPPVAGIAGKAIVGAVSIVLGGGYPEDKDNGEEFTYTGSGGRDLKTGNKRVASQTSDQELTKQNEALARTCDANFNNKTGAVAKNWKNSKPIRVCRTEKLKKHNPKYAPDEGVRYDGIYKIYWPEKGASGFIVWRYLMRRDDIEPAPWTPEGKKRIASLGLKMYIPEECKDTNDKKRGLTQDNLNNRVWNIVLGTEYETLAELISSLVENHFKCPVCHELVQDPVTTPCTHNVCKECITQSVNHYGRKCPECRTEFKEDLKFTKNQNLVDTLKSIIPTYGK
ncbi:1155_t:CDS:2 [Entrophospora sp. SA101]|nr:1155_t:CDS:2 [Entrophospora sp. SA101]